MVNVARRRSGSKQPILGCLFLILSLSGVTCQHEKPQPTPPAADKPASDPSTPAPTADARHADDILVEHLGAMTSLMTNHRDQPAKGVDALHAYLREHLPEISSTLGLAIVELEAIEDDDARLARFDEMQLKVTLPALLWMGALQEFGAQVRNDPEANARWRAIRARFDVFEQRLRPLFDLYR